MADHVHQLLATDTALDKLGARRIAAAEAEQLLRNPQVVVRNPRSAADSGKRRWLIVTGWSSTAAERRMLRDR